MRILEGDCRVLLAALADASVQCVVTSPPYYGLRDYGVDAQIGLEATLAAYITTMVAVFREVRRVLRDDGTCWINLGDSYVSNGRYESDRSTYVGDLTKYAPNEPRPSARAMLMKPKDLMMMPARVALALQADGWWLRSDIIWSKPNPMPESVTDRPTNAHEHVFLLTKSARYFFDGEAVRDAQSEGTHERFGKNPARSQAGIKEVAPGLGMKNNTSFNEGRPTMILPNGRNIRNVWEIATEAFPAAHFATFPTALAERCIRAGTSERGCCAECGSAWVRDVERSVAFTSGSGRAGNVPNGKHAGAVQALSGDYDIRMGPSVSTTTTGWSPSCAHDAAVVPCTVLDPFAGAATTLLVAQRLGRSSIGIELSPAYVALSWERLQAESPYERINPVPDSPAFAGPLLAWAFGGDVVS
jgi:DNA modification methylase